MNIRVLVLAGGKGTRMGAPVPKALVPICGKPIVDYILETVQASALDAKPALVIGHDLTKLRDYVGERAEFVIQQEQLGTGHAVMVAAEALREADLVVVSYGDHPLYAQETWRSIVQKHTEAQATITMLTTELSDFEGWRSIFQQWGRVIRDEQGRVTAVREYKVCTPQECQITEVNNGLYCFNAAWLWENVTKIDNDNPKSEYYLTSLIAMALEQGEGVETISCEPTEGIGVNTPDEVAIAERIVCGHVD